MEPELYYHFEQWRRRQHAEIPVRARYEAEALTLNPSSRARRAHSSEAKETEMPIDAPPSTNTRAVRLTEIARISLKIGAMSYGVGIMLGPQARKERVMRRLLRCGLALVLVMAALPTGDRTAHAADSILTEILRRGTVRIATAVATRPLRFEDENGNLQGYEIDIANRLAKDLGVTIDWIKTNAAGRVAMLQTKQADITISSFTPNLERLKTIGFTDPYSTAVLSLLSR